MYIIIWLTPSIYADEAIFPWYLTFFFELLGSLHLSFNVIQMQPKSMKQVCNLFQIIKLYSHNTVDLNLGIVRSSCACVALVIISQHFFYFHVIYVRH